MTKAELKEKWDKILGALEDEGLDKLKIDTFISPLSPAKISEKEKIFYLTIKGPSFFYVTQVKNYQKQLQSACEKALGKQYTFEVVDKAPEDDENDPIPEESGIGFNPKYTFETFVGGKNNRLALGACLAVAEKAYVKEYNPLFIYSGPGLGKTHLMHAVGQYVSHKYPRKKILYVSTEAFTNELIKAIQEKKQEQFRNKYRKIDLLLFDDVQFLSKFNSAKEEMFNTFDTLYNNGKQIIFTSDKPPKDLEDIPDRLTTRFSWGLTVDIQPPDYETRMAILKNMASLENVEINDETREVLDVIALHVQTNVRELEGAFRRVKAISDLSGEKIDKTLAKKVLTEIFDEPEKRITPSSIKKAVASYYGIKVSEMESTKRSKNIAYPRQIAMYLISKNTNYSTNKIGEFFGGRDHTTVMYSCEKIASEIKTNSSLKSAIDEISRDMAE